MQEGTEKCGYCVFGAFLFRKAQDIIPKIGDKG